MLQFSRFLASGWLAAIYISMGAKMLREKYVDYFSMAKELLGTTLPISFTVESTVWMAIHSGTGHWGSLSFQNIYIGN